MTKIAPAGDFRRGNELVTDLALVPQADQLEGDPRQLKTGELSVTLTDAKRFGISLLLATGSEKHVDELRELAKQKRCKLTPDGLQRAGKIIASKTESELYEALGLQYIEPELREGRGEIALARAGQLPRLVTQKDIRGILLDYPDDILGRFDFIVASVHGQFRMESATQTARILSAVRNPFVTVLGHMTGRQLLRRPGYEKDPCRLRKARRGGRD